MLRCLPGVECGACLPGDLGSSSQRAKLPTDVVPERYNLTIRPDLEKFVFTGEETVDLRIHRNTNTISFNASELAIKNIEVDQDDRVQVLTADEKTIDREVVTVTLRTKLKKGKAKLRLEFSGELNDKMCGFYRSQYNIGGEIRYMAVTQFEAVDARKCFPCWDEPAIKASFKVKLVVPSDKIAISNTPAEKTTTNKEGWNEIVFGETPVMSTYLLAFVVGEFDWLETRASDENRTLVRVYTPVGKKEQGQFALEVAARILPFYTDYFGIPYPLPKLDLVAIPDFAAGAMENWGCVTYREMAILVDSQNSSAAAKQRICTVIAHELAHQWFGNLVTMEWWTHLWLNEGFASWVEYLATDKLFPQWDIWTQFVFNDFTRALFLDALKTSHAVEVEIKDPNEIDEIFDTISYSKGCSIIRMLDAFLGSDVFKKGLHHYLQTFQYRNATTEDLWASLSEVSGVNVKKIMEGWTRQIGYPVIQVKDGPGTDSFILEQTRFLSSGLGDRDHAEKQQLWNVPVSVVTGSSKEPFSTVLEGSRSASISIPNGSQTWFKLNAGQTGFYRVNYTPDLWLRLKGAIEQGLISPVDRLGIQNDAMALARAGYMSTDKVLELFMAYKNDTNYTVWMDLATNLWDIGSLLYDDPCYENFRAYTRSLFSEVAKTVGWNAKPGEDHLVTLLRSLVILRYGRSGDPATVEEARKRFSLFCQGRQNLEPDLRYPVYSIVLENGNAQDYENLIKIFRSAELHEEKIRCLRALGTISSPKELQRTLDFALSPEVRQQDSIFIVESVALNRYGRELAWKFFQDKWDDLCKAFGHGFLFARLISSTTSSFTTEQKALEVERFFSRNEVPQVDRTIQQSIESIRSNASWLQRDGPKIRDWLQRFDP